MTTSSISIDEYVENTTSFIDYSFLNSTSVSIRTSSTLISILTWILRFACIVIIFLCPWANYKLIELFQIRRFHKESSAKWYKNCSKMYVDIRKTERQKSSLDWLNSMIIDFKPYSY